MSDRSFFVDTGHVTGTGGLGEALGKKLQDFDESILVYRKNEDGTKVMDRNGQPTIEGINVDIDTCINWLNSDTLNARSKLLILDVIAQRLNNMYTRASTDRELIHKMEGKNDPSLTQRILEKGEQYKMHLSEANELAIKLTDIYKNTPEELKESREFKQFDTLLKAIFDEVNQRSRS